ncbi:MAG: hypothetical protein ACE5K1_03625 [Acidiferrobacterales bacterium]
MKSLRCQDCNFVAEGETDEVVVAEMFTHSAQHHLDCYEPMFADKAAAMVVEMEGSIVDV